MKWLTDYFLDTQSYFRIIARMDENKKKRLTIDLPYKLHHAVKLKCVREELDMKAVVTEALEEFVKGKTKGKK